MANKKMTNDDFRIMLEGMEVVKFIQIGANNGVHRDPINKLINGKNKWIGVLFEPGKSAFSELTKTYENFEDLILVNSAVSDQDGKVILYCGKTTPHFTLDKTKALNMFQITPDEVEVDVISPKNIISNYDIDYLNLLQIDTEGRDFTIIKEFINCGIKPDIIRFEYVNLNYENTDSNKVMKYLEENGYESYFVEGEGDIISIKNK